MYKLMVLLAALATAATSHAQFQKAVVGIAQIQTAAQNISCQGWDAAAGFNCNADLSEGFRVMLETAIVKTGKMDVLERDQWDALMRERGLGAAGITTSGGTIEGIPGVNYVIYGTITKFGARAGGFGLGLLSRNTSNSRRSGDSYSKLTVQMGVDLKISDVEDLQIIFADTVDGEVVKGKSFSFGSLQNKEDTADPFADVQRIVANKIAEVIATDYVPIKIIQSQSDGTLILNCGDVFFEPGDELVLMEVGEPFKDPDTGEFLGSEEREIGRIEVTDAQSRFSKARFLSKPVEFARGTVLKRPPEPVVSKKDQNKRKCSGGKLSRSPQDRPPARLR